MAVATGLEPIPTESKSVVLPLHYATVVGIKGVGPLSYAYKAHALTVELDPIVRTKKVPGFLRPNESTGNKKPGDFYITGQSSFHNNSRILLLRT